MNRPTTGSLCCGLNEASSAFSVISTKTSTLEKPKKQTQEEEEGMGGINKKEEQKRAAFMSYGISSFPLMYCFKHSFVSKYDLSATVRAEKST